MKHTTTVVLTEALPAAGMQLLQTRADLRVVLLCEPTAEALKAAIPDADVVVMTMERPALTAGHIALCQRLRAVCRFGAGYDNVDLAALTQRGIPLATTGDANAGTVAEHALYLMLALARRGAALDRAVKAGTWPRNFGGIELAGRTCAVVGYGRIGQAVARLIAAFGMDIIAVDPKLPGAASLQEALPKADFVVLACALNARTRGLIDAEALARMKRGAFLINVARGAVVDEDALVGALRTGRLAGAGLDVLSVEPPSPGNPLLERDDVVLTPHVAAYVETAYDRMALACARAVLEAADGCLAASAVVNPEVLKK